MKEQLSSDGRTSASKTSGPMIACCLAALLLLAAPATRVSADAGDLDPVFGQGGKVTTDFGDQEYGSGLAIQNDGRIVVVGSTDAISPWGGFALVRYVERPFGPELRSGR